MIAYKGFNKGLKCRGYQFKVGQNVTEKAKAVAYGFHCAENPLDCLTYYGNMESAEYWIVDAGGDVDEDGSDTKIACTELTILKRLSKEDFVLHALAYMTDKPKREWNRHVQKERGEVSQHGFVIVRGMDPIAKGEIGDILAFAREDCRGNIVEVAMAVIDGETLLQNRWYGVDLTERQVQP